MDPFTSLGIATSVITVVDYGTKLIKGAREIYKSGSIAENDQVKAVANDLRQLNRTLHSALGSALTPALLLTEDELVRKGAPISSHSELTNLKRNSKKLEPRQLRLRMS
jgi:hypothetical protein